MDNKRLFKVLLQLSIVLASQVQFTSADECGTKFVDPVSSAVLAQVVFQGSVSEMDPASRPDNTHAANVSIQHVLKGMELLKGMGVPLEGSVMVDRFGQERDGEECVAAMDDMTAQTPHLFFTRPSASHSPGLLHMTALPVRAQDDLMEEVKSTLCETCVEAPLIRRVRCLQCARAPVVRRVRGRRVKIGKRGRMRCTAFGLPHPTFSWFKDGLPITSGSGGVIVTSTHKMSILTIDHVTIAHAGSYTCSAQNDLGTGERTAVLKVTARDQKSKPSYTVQTAPDLRMCVSSDVCNNGGTCFYSPSLELRYCRCKPGFEGVKCENIVERRDAPRSRVGFNVSTNIATLGVSDTLQGGKSGHASSTGLSISPNTSSVGVPQTTTTIPENATLSTASMVGITNTTMKSTNNNEPMDTKSMLTVPTNTPVGNNETQEENLITPPMVNSTSFISSFPDTTAITTRGTSEKDVTLTPITLVPSSKPKLPTRRIYRKPKAGKRRKKSKVKPRRPTSPGSVRYANLDVEAAKLLISRPGTKQCSGISQCLNGGSCFHASTLGITFCACPEGYRGTHCEFA